MKKKRIPIAVFISSHGFGHAARACAVMEALGKTRPECYFHIFGTTPAWFFRESLTISYTVHDLVTDVGFVQKDPFLEDLDATVKKLSQFIPFPEVIIDRLSHLFHAHNIGFILSDISPLGIYLGKRLSIPCVLIENFTWDWIYQHYLSKSPQLRVFIDYLSPLYSDVTLHIQCEPACLNSKSAVKVSPVSRSPRISREKIRSQLHLSDTEKMVLISQGGVPWTFQEYRTFSIFNDTIFVILCNTKRMKKSGNVLLMPTQSSFYHPDLMHAADCLIGKLGYSTVAEAYFAGIPFGMISRPHFPETETLARFLAMHNTTAFFSPKLLDIADEPEKLHRLLKASRIDDQRKNGSQEAADFINNNLP